MTGFYAGIPVVVLGANGFIGRWVASLLTSQGAQLSLIVRDAKSAPAIFPYFGVEGRVYCHDLLNPGGLKGLFAQTRPSITFNLAGYGVDPEERDAELALRINVGLVDELCEVVASVRDPAWQGQDLIHVGSAMEYGTIGGNLREESDPKPTTLYGRSKLAGTARLQACCLAHGVKGMVARLFTVYGPGEHPQRLLPSLLKCAKTGETLGLTAGLQQRDFTYVEDVAEGLLRLGCCRAAPGEIVNLATGRLTSVRAFAQTAAEILGIREDGLAFGALAGRPEEMSHAEVSLARLYRLIQWIPSTTIEEGIRRTASFSARGQRSSRLQSAQGDLER